MELSLRKNASYDFEKNKKIHAFLKQSSVLLNKNSSLDCLEKHKELSLLFKIRGVFFSQ